jgi:hypothetical protein
VDLSVKDYWSGFIETIFPIQFYSLFFWVVKKSFQEKERKKRRYVSKFNLRKDVQVIKLKKVFIRNKSKTTRD